MKRLFVLFLAIGVSVGALFAQKGSLVAGSGERKIVTTGMGVTPEAAVKDALRSAVEMVVGAVVNSETRIANDEIISDEILTLSHGFVRKYEKVAESANGADGYTVTVAAIVTEKHIADKLQAKGVTVNYNTSALFAQYKEWDRLAEAERAMADKLFGLKTIKKKSCNVYDYELTVGEPVRVDGKYKIKVHRKMTKNANWEAEYQSMLATLDEICYEKTVLDYVPLGKHKYMKSVGNGSYGGGLYIQTYTSDYDEAGEPILSQREVVLERLTTPDPFTTIGQSYLRDNCFLRYQDHRKMTDQDAEFRARYMQMNRKTTEQDRSRMNNSYLPDYIFDIFQKTYTPYVYVVLEDNDGDYFHYDRVIIYKFTHPDTSRIIHFYATWLFAEMHHNVRFGYPNGVGNPSRGNTVYNCTGTFRGASFNQHGTGYDVQQGFFFNKPNHRWVSFHSTWTLNESDFSRLQEITVIPTSDTHLLEQIYR